MNENHSAAFDKAKKEYEAGRWSKAMLKILVQRKPQRLTEAEYTEITGEQYARAAADRPADRHAAPAA